MNTILERFDGTELIRPLGEFRWPHPTFAGFPECCGSGSAQSLSQKAVPESILGMRVGPACCVHDWMFEHGPQTWQTFHYANSVFLANLLQINRDRGGMWLLRLLRKPIILSWFIAVSSTVGAQHFFKRAG